MNLTCWDKTVKLEGIRLKLREIRFKHARSGNIDKQRILVDEYQSIAREIDKEMLDRWFK